MLSVKPSNKLMLEKLMAAEFAALDVQLFLNTHPNNTEAIKTYNQLIALSMELREQYEEQFGPLYSFVSYSPDSRFVWTEQPWPWEKG